MVPMYTIMNKGTSWASLWMMVVCPFAGNILTMGAAIQENWSATTVMDKILIALFSVMTLMPLRLALLRSLGYLVCISSLVLHGPQIQFQSNLWTPGWYTRQLDHQSISHRHGITQAWDWRSWFLLGIHTLYDGPHHCRRSKHTRSTGSRKMAVLTETLRSAWPLVLWALPSSLQWQFVCCLAVIIGWSWNLCTVLFRLLVLSCLRSTWCSWDTKDGTSCSSMDSIRMDNQPLHLCLPCFLSWWSWLWIFAWIFLERRSVVEGNKSGSIAPPMQHMQGSRRWLISTFPLVVLFVRKNLCLNLFGKHSATNAAHATCGLSVTNAQSNSVSCVVNVIKVAWIQVIKGKVLVLSDFFCKQFETFYIYGQ